MRNLVLTFLILQFPISSIFSQNNWVLEKNTNGIKVYTRVVSGSDIKEFKATVSGDYSIDKVEKILDDYESFPQWQANLTRISTIKKISDTQIFEHYFTDLPWPVDDRDLVTFMQKKASTDGKSITYTYTSIPNYIPEVKDYERIKESSGFWQINRTGEKTVEIIYQFKADPGGSIPDWLINSFLVEGPFETMSNLKKKL